MLADAESIYSPREGACRPSSVHLCTLCCVETDTSSSAWPPPASTTAQSRLWLRLCASLRGRQRKSALALAICQCPRRPAGATPSHRHRHRRPCCAPPLRAMDIPPPAAACVSTPRLEIAPCAALAAQLIDVRTTEKEKGKKQQKKSRSGSTAKQSRAEIATCSCMSACTRSPRRCPQTRPSVCPSARPSVRPSVLLSGGDNANSQPLPRKNTHPPAVFRPPVSPAITPAI